VAQPAEGSRPVDEAVAEDVPSYDPVAIQRAYARERARRHRRTARRHDARSSNARFWVVLAFLVFLTVLLALTAWHEIQTTFGV